MDPYLIGAAKDAVDSSRTRDQGATGQIQDYFF